MMRKAFTLIEVNLAMLIMAGGILSLVGLYSFGFRESRQSREDVESAALAEHVMSQIVSQISATNHLWSQFRTIESYPNEDGWGYFLSSRGRINSLSSGSTMLSAVMNKYKPASGDSVSENAPSGFDLDFALVVMHDRDSPLVRIGFRAYSSKDLLMSMPLYYTEVRFQGIIDR